MNRTDTRIAIVGGGRACRELLSRIQADPERFGMRVVGVADPDPDSPGIAYARQIGVGLIVSDYTVFLSRDDIDLIVELTGRPEVRDAIQRSLPPGVHFVDHYTSRFFWDLFALADEHSRLREQRDRDILSERNRLARILDSLPYEILVINKDFEVELANRTFLEAHGTDLDAVRGRYCYDLDHKTKPPCGVTVDECPHAETIRAGASFAKVVPVRDEDGSERFVSVRTAPIRDENGEVQGVVEAIRDITQRIQTEQQLQDTRARLNQFIDTAPLFIYMKDINLRFRVINRHALEKLGRREEEVVGKTDQGLFPDNVAQGLRRAEREALRTGKPVRTGGVLPIRDGDMHFSATLFPVLRDDEPIGLFGLVEDVTELRESEQRLLRKHEQLSETQKLLEGVLEHSRDMIFLTDPEGILRSFNSGAERTLDRLRTDVVGTPAADLCAEPAVFRELLARALAEGHVTQYEMGFLRRDGEVLVTNASLTAIDGPDGAPAEVVGICRDITPRLRLREDLVRSERLAAIGKLAAGVAHEINNPLAVISTIAGVLSDTVDEEADNLHPASRDILRKVAERLDVQVRRATTITHSLLGFVRKSRGGLQDVAVTDLLDECLNLLASEINTVGCEIRRDYAEGLPRVFSDPMLLQQVFVNLIKNAIEAIEEVRPRRGAVTLVARAEDAGGLAIAVEDDGVGIPPEALQSIFDLFHTSKPAGKGTGLGLAIVHDIVGRLGCSLQVESDEGVRTRFTLRIPPRAPERTGEAHGTPPEAPPDAPPGPDSGANPGPTPR